MKKFFITFCTLVFALTVNTQMNAQSKDATRIFKKGQADLNIGLGVIPTYFLDKGTTVFIPVMVSADFMVGKTFSVGAFSSYSVSDGQERAYPTGKGGPHSGPTEIMGQWRNTYSEIGVRGAFHYIQRDNFDVYGGVSIAYTNIKIESLKEGTEELEGHLGIKPVNNKVVPSAFIGAKYALTPRISAFSEVGFSSSLLKVGVSMRFL